ALDCLLRLCADFSRLCVRRSVTSNNVLLDNGRTRNRLVTRAGLSAVLLKEELYPKPTAASHRTAAL
ncbi:MAG: hypothetical protein ACI4J8_07525, partial [Oscillospiraceae bacterium]